MATVMGPVRSSSFLPTIRCSSCSAEIEISRMGDHVCSEVSLPPSTFAPLELHYIQSKPSLSNGAVMKAGNGRSPRVTNLNIRTNASLRPVDRQPATLLASASRKLSQNSTSSGRRSPLEIPNQNTVPPSNLSLSSAVSLPQDCAFPPFPTSRSRSATPVTPSEPAQSFATHPDSHPASARGNPIIPPLSPYKDGMSFLLKMDTGMPGAGSGFQPKGHRRNPTMGSSKDFAFQEMSEKSKDYGARPSTAGSIASRKPSLSSISGGPRSKLIQTNADSPMLPTKRDNSPAAGNFEGNKVGGMVRRQMSIEKLHYENRSRTYPVVNPFKEGNDVRRPSAPSIHMKRPSVAAAIRPLHEIGSVSTFKPSRSLKGRRRSQVALIVDEPAAMPTENRTEGRREIDKTPALTLSNSEHLVGNHHHTPAESTSSYSSSKSGVGSASSISTNSLSGSPQRQKQAPSDTGHHIFIPDFRFKTRSQFNFDEPASPHNTSLPRLNLPIRTDLAGSTNLPNSRIGALSPVRDPAVHSGRSSPVAPPADHSPALPNRSEGLVAPLGHVPAPSNRPPMTNSAASANKGRCRGCDEFIVGKSVSSADGRLTGRYHKGCFKCTTCKEPFRTADFYVHGNHPYCQQHYHQLNHSLCMACDSGIEGQYVEAEHGQKFHQDCFTCNECKNILQGHYFEINGEAYCERHALRDMHWQHRQQKQQQQQAGLPSQQRGMGPGPRPHAERRQTRLLMMTP